jgi:hypothetical protein
MGGFMFLVAVGALASLPAGAAPAIQDEEDFAGSDKCALCHEEIAEAYDELVHSVADCEDCHGPGADHVGTMGNKGKIRSFKDTPSEEVVGACLECHEEDESAHITEFRGGPWEKRGMTCVSCHRVHAVTAETVEPTEPSRPPLTATTCLVCHADPSYNRDFAHRELETKEAACSACHSGGAEHLAKRGAPGTIESPNLLPAAGEASLCLRCHEGFEQVIHFSDQPESTRCTSCHDLHRLMPPEIPGSGDEGTGETGKLPAETVESGGAWLRGSLRLGGRLVGGEDGRYEEEIDLDDGARLFDLDAEFGTADGNPDEVRGSLKLDGLGDPYESLLVRLRRRDQWSFRAKGSRSDLPFLGSGGLHPGETERDRLDARVSLDATREVEVATGIHVLDVDGDVRGTLFDGGSVIPVVGRQDRRTEELWGSVDVRRKGWHLGLRQSWLDEDADDDRTRNKPSTTTPDRLLFNDDSSMKGPVTSLVGDADLAGGSWTVAIRASMGRFDRDVDVTEQRAGFAGTAPFTRTTSSRGDRDRNVDRVGLETAVEVSDTLAVEASVERRSLRENGALRFRETVDAGLGPVTTSHSEKDRIRQVLLSETLGFRWAANDALTVRAGGEQWTDELDESGVTDETIVTRGAYAGLDARLSDRFKAAFEGRTTDSRGSFTALTPEDRADLSARVSYRDRDGRRGRFSWRRTQVEADDSGLGSDGDALAVSFGFGDEQGWTVDLGASWYRQDVRVDTLAFVGTTLQAGKARSEVQATTLDLRLGVPLTSRVRGEFTTVYLRDHGDLPIRGVDAVLGLHWQIREALGAGLRFRQRVYDEVGDDTYDYNARILEIYAEFDF